MNDERIAEPFWKSPFMRGVAGLFFVAVFANLIMVAFSLTAAPGLVSEDYYARGKSYTSRTKVDYLAKPGAVATIAGLDRLRVGVASTVTITGDDAMTGAILYAYRPADARQDFSAPLTRDQEGRFSGTVAFPLKGNWDLIAEPVGADNRPLPGIARRVFVAE